MERHTRHTGTNPQPKPAHTETSRREAHTVTQAHSHSHTYAFAQPGPETRHLPPTSRASNSSQRTRLSALGSPHSSLRNSLEQAITHHSETLGSSLLSTHTASPRPRFPRHPRSPRTQTNKTIPSTILHPLGAPVVPRFPDQGNRTRLRFPQQPMSSWDLPRRRACVNRGPRRPIPPLPRVLLGRLASSRRSGDRAAGAAPSASDPARAKPAGPGGPRNESGQKCLRQLGQQGQQHLSGSLGKPGRSVVRRE